MFVFSLCKRKFPGTHWFKKSLLSLMVFFPLSAVFNVLKFPVKYTVLLAYVTFTRLRQSRGIIINVINGNSACANTAEISFMDGKENVPDFDSCAAIGLPGVKKRLL